MLLISRGARKIRHREALVIVGLCWILVSLIGALPAVIGGYIPSFIDSFFEIRFRIYYDGRNDFNRF